MNLLNRALNNKSLFFISFFFEKNSMPFAMIIAEGM